MNINNESKSLNKKWELVNFCEFDKYATKSYCAIHNVDESLNLGDITKVDETDLDDFNMICGGSPCQDFSVAGKQKGSVWTCKDCGHEYNPLTVHWSKRDCCPNCGSENIEKTRSSLLVEYLRVVRANKPNFGIYENVKNIVGKQFKDTTFKLFTDELEEYGYNVYWKVLNAKNYGIPQNRERVYLLFIKKDLDNGKFEFPEPFDNGLRLKDLLEDKVDEKFYISDEKTKKFISSIESKYEKSQNDKFVCEERKDEGLRTYKNDVCGALRTIDSCGDKRVVEIDQPKFIENVNREDFGTGYAGSVWDDTHISPTLMTMQGGGRQPHVITGLVKNKGENFTKETEYANTLLARDYKGFGNQEMNCVVENDKVTIKQATKQGYIECEVGGVADLSYPDSKTRRDRVQDNGNTCQTITATETGICRIEPKERFFKQADFGNFYDYILAIFECLDCMKSIMEEGLKDEERYKKYRKVLYVLWEEIRKKTIQWETRGFWCVPKEKILQSRMYGAIQTDAAKSRCDLEDSTPNSAENKRKNTEKNEVRNMWEDWEVRCSSYKLELERQFIDEFTSVMSKLSYQNTQNKKRMLDMWRTDERVRILQQALSEIQELRMSIDEKEKSKVSNLQKDNRKSNGMCGIRIRKLTPRETFRLMGFSDENFDAAQKAGVSNSQLYKQAGNSIVVDVLYYIYVELYKAMPYLFDNLKLSSFFSGIGAFEIALDRLYKDINSENFINPQEE